MILSCFAITTAPAHDADARQMLVRHRLRTVTSPPPATSRPNVMRRPS